MRIEEFVEYFRRYSSISLAGIAALALHSAPAAALNFDKLSLVGAANVSQFTLVPASGNKAISDAHLGYGGGLLTEIDISARSAIGIEVGALYVQRKYGDTSVTLTETRVEVPAMLRLWLGRLGIGAGAYAAYGLGTIRVAGGAAQSYEARQLKPLDFGWVGSAALAIGFGKRSKNSLLLDGRVGKSVGNSSSATGATGNYLNLQVLTGIQLDI